MGRVRGALVRIARGWGHVEVALHRLLRLLRRRAGRVQREVEAEARLAEAEVRQVGARLLEPFEGFTLFDAVLGIAPISTQYYGHGAFMGAAPALLADAKWRRILAVLMPDVFADVRKALDEGDPMPTVIAMLENNPVMAAFGSLQAHAVSGDDESEHHLAGMEWDLFVDQEQIEAWEATDTDEARLLCIVRAVDSSLIAHARSTDTVQESMGICQYRDVRRTPKSGLGGVELPVWIDLYARALELEFVADLEGALAQMEAERRIDAHEACELHVFVERFTMERALELHARAARGRRFSVVLDIKSLRTTPAFLSGFVAEMNRRGLHVSGVGSFLRAELEGVSRQPQTVSGELLEGPREIQFFHYAGDLQFACDGEQIVYGQSVMFNGASLLDVVSAADGSATYSANYEVLDDLERYRARHGLTIGFYVQEPDCDAEAASLLSDIATARSETFALGFAWGGLRDGANLPRSEAPRLGLGSQRLLEVVGRARRWCLLSLSEPPASREGESRPD